MSSFRFAVHCEPLETRHLLAWGAAPALIQQDVAAEVYPQLKGQGVTVAVIDTGIDYTHPNLGGGFGPGHKVKGGHDFVDNDDDPMDTFGHGTNVAGTIAASPFTINGEQYSGVAPDANLVALRVSADGNNVSSETIEAALKWIQDNRIAMGISVVNFSFGAGNHNSPFTDPVVSDDLAILKDAGVLIVCPSGNGGTSGGEGIEWPAADPSVVGVGSVATNY
jgi:subtilisin family serine protease